MTTKNKLSVSRKKIKKVKGRAHLGMPTPVWEFTDDPLRHRWWKSVGFKTRKATLLIEL